MKLQKNPYALLSFTALLSIIVLNFSNILSGLSALISSLTPLVIGAILAFVVNVPMKKVEKLLARFNLSESLRRVLAIVLVFIVMVMIVTLTLAIVLPNLTQVGTTLGTHLTYLEDVVLTWMNRNFQSSSDFQNQLSQAISSHSGTLASLTSDFLNSLGETINSLLSGTMNLILGLIFMVSILASKESLSRNTIRLLKRLLPEKFVKRLIYIGHVCVETYDNFFFGQLIESFILGGLIFLGFSLFGLPYAGLSAILTAVLAFVPYVGAFAACAISAIFIFTVSPILALWSIILSQTIQFIENNLIYPRVVGSSIGLPALFTLSAAIIGGSLFGLLGMIFFTPIFAVIYRLIKEFVIEGEHTKLISGGN